ncbi:MAG: hypothetical protein V4733_11525 [Verrucomicrobiota bacterium]
MIRIVLLLLLPLCGFLPADEIRLADAGAHLSGQVRAVDADGRVEVVSGLSAAPAPLRLKAGTVRSIRFSTEDHELSHPLVRLELINGDVLQVDLHNLSDDGVEVASPVFGRVVVPRKLVKILQVGTGDNDLIYSGPRSLAEWTVRTKEGSLEFAGGKLIASGAVSGKADFQLPQRFVLKFTAAWEDRPNFRVDFAAPDDGSGDPRNGYQFQFNSSGILLQRASPENRTTTLTRIPVQQDQFRDQRVQVEIHVDRRASRLRVFLNGELKGECNDRVKSKANGGGLVFETMSQPGRRHEFSGISIKELDDMLQRHRDEERGDSKRDSLISREDDRWSGRLADMRTNAGRRLFSFAVGFRDEVLEIPMADVSTIFFAEAQTGHGKTNNVCTVKLASGGTLTAESCVIGQDAVTVRHGLLGELTLKRSGLTAIEWPEPAAKKP